MKLVYQLMYGGRYRGLYDQLAKELRRGNHEAAIATAEACIALGEKCFGSDDPELVAPLYALSSASLAAGQFDTATAASERAIAIANDQPTQPPLGQLLEQRAAIADRAKDGAAFEEALRRGLDEDDASARATAHNRLALHLARQEQFAEAHEHFDAAMSLREEVAGEDLELAEVLHNAATFRHPEDADLVQAQAMFERALDISKRHLSPRASELEARIAHNLAVLLQERLDDDAALDKYTEALAAFERDHDAADPTLRPTLARLGRLLQVKKRFDEAVPMLRRAHAIATVELGEEHEVTGRLALWLGDANSHTFR